MNLKENLRRKLTLNSYELLLFNLIMEFYCENVMIIIFMSIFIGFRNKMENGEKRQSTMNPTKIESCPNRKCWRE